jgi:hypothetical protein
MKVKFGFLFSMIAIALGFQSCSLNTGSNGSNPASYFLVANFSPNAVPLDCYVDGSLVASSLSFTNTTPGYAGEPSGSYNFILAATGTTQQLINVTYSFAPNTNYSVFAIDTVLNGTLQTALVQDVLTNPIGDSAKIRFLDFAPNAGTIDLVPVNGGPAFDSGRYFNDQAIYSAYSNFVSVHAPLATDTTYSFNIRQSGSTQTILINNANVSVTAGKIYTIVLGGLLNPTPSEQPLSISVINNP